MKSILFSIACLVSLTIPSGLRAQYSWKITHSDQAGGYQYWFYTVDCSGGVCTAAGIKVDTSVPIGQGARFAPMFFRSTDNGLTWSEQNPGLPAQWQDDTFIVRVQQIDSLNAVSISTDGMILRTFDGGQTWQQQNGPTGGSVILQALNVHFSDSTTGIATQSNNIFTTLDGGANWVLAPFSPGYISECHSDGGTNFRVFTYGSGRVYQTADNWQTVDSTPSLQSDYQDSDFGAGLNFQGIDGACNFLGEDTIVAPGYVQDTVDSLNPTYLLLFKSIDGGKDWTRINIPDTLVPSGSGICMSGLEQDVAFMGGLPTENWILESSDHGMSWAVDTLIEDQTASSFIGESPYQPGSLSMAGDGSCVGVFTFDEYATSPCYLGRIEKADLGVVNTIEPVLEMTLFPNPSSSVINIESSSGSYSITDPLGRSYAVPILTGEGASLMRMDISLLPSGVYFLSDGQTRAKFVKE